MMLPMEISAQEVKARLDAGEKLFLIDVREPQEFAIAKIAGGELVPMRTVPTKLSEIQARAAESAIVVYCHHGVRSMNVVHWLRGQGIERCQSMSGGIDAWSRGIDPNVPRY